MFQNLEEKIEKYLENINKLKNKAKEIRNNLLNEKYNFFLENKHIINLKEYNSFSVVAADSGFFNNYLTGIDYVFVKTAGNYMLYDNGKIKSYKKTNKQNNLFIAKEILQKDEVMKFTSIKRIQEELKVILKLIYEYSPDFALIDGSIIPQPVDRPKNNSTIFEEYIEMINLYEELYNIKNTIIVGCIEDSRANSFISEINFDYKNINDTVLLNYILKEKEALAFFETFKEESNIIQQDFNNKYKFYTSYLKINNDYPLRIETINKHFEKIRNTIYFLSNHNKNYAYPSVLIDADKLAKLNKQEIININQFISKKLQVYGIKEFRRNRRL